jgi:PTH1 family peptidyl-tRNA hydrolase
MTHEHTSENPGTPISLVAALGNPGPQYAFSRHNIAWLMIEYLSFFPELDWREKFKGEFARHRIGDEPVFFLKPWTYMNLSGRSLVELMNFYKLEPEQVLVIHDELELDFGVAGFKRGGGLGGHNGLRSTASCLGTRDFNRLRLGISRPSHSDITSYVLGPFSEDEEAVLPSYLEEAAKILETCLVEGFDAVEKPFRKKRLIMPSATRGGF